MRGGLTHKIEIWALLAAWGFIMLVTACAGMEPGPARKEINIAESSLRLAEAGDARVYAPSQFRLAEKKLEQAEVALRNGKYVAARRLAEQADTDARLSAARAQNAQTQEMVTYLQRSIGDLQREIELNERISNADGG